MPWPSNGDYYGFKEDAIKSNAPPISGVYGIYNFNHHILIGHSNNLRKALLRHHSETKFRFRRLQPTGFTFEVCPTESKGFRAEELIWEYDPILRNDGSSIGLAAWWRSWVTPRARNFHSAVETFKPAAIEASKLDPLKAPGKPLTERARARRDDYAMLTSGIAFAVVAIALYVLLGENKTIAESWTRQLVPLAQGVTSSSSDHTRTAALPPLPPPPGAAASATDAPIKSPKGQPAANANNPPEISPLITGSSKADGIVPSDAESVRKPDIAAPINNLASSQTINKSDLRPGWTVQALATTDGNEAKNWLDRLKSKGYDAYIINAETKGLNWYRVRVGNLRSHHEAEELGLTLRTREGLSGAFITSRVKSDLVITSTDRSSHLRSSTGHPLTPRQ